MNSKSVVWKQFRRAIFCRLMHDDSKQLYLPGFRPDTIIVTNIGQGQAIDGILKKAGALDYLTTNGLIACYHECGSDELASEIPSSLANCLMGWLCGGIIFFNTASFRSGEYHMNFPPAPFYRRFRFIRQLS